MSARFTPPTARNARSWSLSTVVGSTSRIGAHDCLATRAAWREPPADGGVVDGDTATIAELVGDERDHRHRVDCGVESSEARRGAGRDRARDKRRGHQSAGVEQADDITVLLDAVLVAHRPPDARSPAS